MTWSVYGVKYLDKFPNRVKYLMKMLVVIVKLIIPKIKYQFVK